MINQKILNQFRDVLWREGFKYTPQRVAVLEEIIKDHGHRECEDIYLTLRQQSKNVSRATVYRTMDILVKNNFARKLNLGDGRFRYESKIDIPHHDHLVCTACGKIVEFVDQKIENLQEDVAKQYDFILTRHIHQLFGICKKCGDTEELKSVDWFSRDQLLNSPENDVLRLPRQDSIARRLIDDWLSDKTTL